MEKAYVRGSIRSIKEQYQKSLTLYLIFSASNSNVRLFVFQRSVLKVSSGNITGAKKLIPVKIKFFTY